MADEQRGARPRPTPQQGIDEFFDDFLGKAKSEEAGAPAGDQVRAMYDRVKPWLICTFAAVGENLTLRTATKPLIDLASVNLSTGHLEVFRRAVARFLKDVRSGKVVIPLPDGEDDGFCHWTDWLDSIWAAARDESLADEEIEENDEDSGRWKLRDEDRGVIGLLVDAARGLIPKATDGVDLIAIGEVWDALERIERGDEVEVLVELSVGFRRGDRDFQEGLFVCIRVDPDEILLSELNTSYSSDVGSDHFTNRYASLRRDGGFDEVSVNDWLNRLDEVSRADDARLRASRDHV